MQKLLARSANLPTTGRLYILPSVFFKSLGDQLSQDLLDRFSHFLTRWYLPRYHHCV